MTTSETKKPRAMTVKGFLHKANGNSAPLAFLAAHRAWLETGELAAVTSPILAKLDSKELLPTPAKEAIMAAVFNHQLAQDLESSKATLAHPAKVKGEKGARAAREEKPHTVVIYTAEGNVATREVLDEETGAIDVVDLIGGFDMIQDAQGWTDRRLEENPGCHGIITSHKLRRADGSVWTEKVERDYKHSSRMEGRTGGPVMKKRPQSTPRLGFGVKARNDRSVFSRG